VAGPRPVRAEEPSYLAHKNLSSESCLLDARRYGSNPEGAEFANIETQSGLFAEGQPQIAAELCYVWARFETGC